MTLQTVARELFKSSEAQFINERNRPDIVVLPEKTTWQMTGIESFDLSDPTLTQIQHVLVIELKKGGFELTRKEVNQADGYVRTSPLPERCPAAPSSARGWSDRRLLQVWNATSSSAIRHTGA